MLAIQNINININKFKNSEIKFLNQSNLNQIKFHLPCYIQIDLRRYLNSIEEADVVLFPSGTVHAGYEESTIPISINL